MDRIYIFNKLFRCQTGMKAMETFQFVDRTSRMSQSSAGHLCDRNSRCCRKRTDDQCCLISHSTGTVLVDLLPMNCRQIHQITALCHGKSQILCLFFIHSGKADRHQHGRHLIIRDLTAAVAVDHITDLLRREGLPVALFHDQIAHSHRRYAPLCFFLP